MILHIGDISCLLILWSLAQRPKLELGSIQGFFFFNTGVNSIPDLYSSAVSPRSDNRATQGQW